MGADCILLIAALPLMIFFRSASTKSRAGGLRPASFSMLEGGKAAFAAATSARFAAMMRSRMVKASVSPQFPFNCRLNATNSSSLRRASPLAMVRRARSTPSLWVFASPAT